jgi:hypothetical protein
VIGAGGDSILALFVVDGELDDDGDLFLFDDDFVFDPPVLYF